LAQTLDRHLAVRNTAGCSAYSLWLQGLAGPVLAL